MFTSHQFTVVEFALHHYTKLLERGMLPESPLLDIEEVEGLRDTLGSCVGEEGELSAGILQISGPQIGTMLRALHIFGTRLSKPNTSACYDRRGVLTPVTVADVIGAVEAIEIFLGKEQGEEEGEGEGEQDEESGKKS